MADAKPLAVEHQTGGRVIVTLAIDAEHRAQIMLPVDRYDDRTIAELAAKISDQAPRRRGEV